MASLNEKGRITVGFMTKLIRAHILIWAWMTGEWPKDQIDHRDEDPSNNKWDNLREATKSQNMMNIAKIKSNTSGYKGVCFNKMAQKWMAYIKLDNKRYHLGLFATPEEACAAYQDAANKLHGDFAKYYKNLPSALIR